MRFEYSDREEGTVVVTGFNALLKLVRSMPIGREQAISIVDNKSTRPVCRVLRGKRSRFYFTDEMGRPYRSVLGADYHNNYVNIKNIEVFLKALIAETAKCVN